MTRKERFRVSGKITKLLGRESVADPVTALFEVIKNSHDADALLVSVKFQDFEKNQGKIILKEKKGQGMTHKDIKNKFFVIGTYSKDTKKLKNRVTKRLKRVMLGQKGVGRFAMEKLGREVSITSKPYTGNTQYSFKINWDRFEPEEVTVDQIPIQVKEEKISQSENSGLEIVISRLRDEWDAEKIKRLMEYLKGFVLPRELQPKNAFNIELEAPSFGIERHVIEPELSEKAFYTLTASLQGGKITYSAEKLGHSYIRKNTVTSFRSHLTSKERKVSSLQCGSVKLHVYYFPIFSKGDKLAEHYYEKAFEHYGEEFYTQIKKTLKDKAGVKIYRGGLREFKYGDPGFDWVDRASISRAHAGTMQADKIVGFCILGKNNDKIIATTNRTEAVENQPFLDLKDFVISAMKKLDIKISEDRAELYDEWKEEQKKLDEKLAKTESKYSKTQVAKAAPDLMADFNKARKALQERNLEEESNVTISEIEYSHVAMGHFISKLFHDFVGPSTDIFEGSIAKLDSHTKGVKLQTAEELEKTVEKLGKKWKQIRVIFDALNTIETGMGVENYYKREKIDIRPKQDLEDIFQDMCMITNFYNITFKNQIDSKIEIWTYGPIFFSVMYNIISNSFKAFLKQKDRNKRENIVLAKAIIEDKYLNFIIADNSTNPIRRDRWTVVFEPWISTTSGLREFHGKGIGLSICREILKFVRGRIEIVEPVLSGGTTFVVRFPLGIINK